MSFGEWTSMKLCSSQNSRMAISDGGFDLEEQVIDRTAQVHVAPIQAVIQDGQRFGKGIERQRAFRRIVDDHGFQLNF